MGANLWVCGQGGDFVQEDDLLTVTTENSDRYTYNFNGTSSAAPIVSGVAALVREANPSLTWRDVKLVLADSARKNDPDNSRLGGGRTHLRLHLGFRPLQLQPRVRLRRSRCRCCRRSREGLDQPAPNARGDRPVCEDRSTHTRRLRRRKHRDRHTDPRHRL